MKTWLREKALDRAKNERLKRYRDREGLRLLWFQLGFRDGYDAAMEELDFKMRSKETLNKGGQA